ncbi:hypothetical protein M405DRAFT_787068, partial [Rhizopogon salebrosus TDB-379]
MPSNHRTLASSKENVSPNGCEGRHVCNKTKPMVMPISLKVTGDESTSTLRVSALAGLADQGGQYLLINPAYRLTVALDVTSSLRSADRRAKELTESPLAEVTDAFASSWPPFQSYTCRFLSPRVIIVFIHPCVEMTRS